MKYVQKNMGAAADNSAAQGGVFKELVRLSLIVAALAAAVYLAVGLIVDAVVPRISVETEKRIFQNFSSPDADPDDPRIQRIEPLLKRLTANEEVPDLDYTVFVFEEKEPNAVAMPGGHIGVTTGLLKALDDDVALSFVLGHELGHFKNRDHLRGLGRSIGLAVCYSILFGKNDAGKFIGGNTVNLMSKKYSRGQEEKADRFGVYLVYKTYGSTDGADKLFRILEKKHKLPGWAYMFATHPQHSKRIAAMKKYAAELAAADAKNKAP